MAQTGIFLNGNVANVVFKPVNCNRPNKQPKTEAFFINKAVTSQSKKFLFTHRCNLTFTHCSHKGLICKLCSTSTI